MVHFPMLGKLRSGPLIALALSYGFQIVHAEVYTAPSTSANYRVERSYELGVARESYVGEQMVHVRDYLITTRESGTAAQRLSASQDFYIQYKPYMQAHIRANDDIIVTGTTERNGKSYRLILLPSPKVSAVRFLVDDQGAIQGSWPLKENGKPLKIDYTVDPEMVRLVTAPSRAEVDTRRGAINFELIYSGTTKDSFQLLYREYTDEDMARPAFSQTVVYERSARTIHFRRMQINVMEASNEKIRYTVVSDGISASTAK